MRKFILLMLGVVCFLLSTASNVRAEDDWQYWNMVYAKGQVSEEVSWRIFTEQWFSDDVTNFYLANVDTGLTWKPSKYFSLGGFYRYQTVMPKGADTTAEHRYYPEITFYAPLKFVKISDRTRFEYHDTNRQDYWWFRNKLKVSVPTKIGDFPITPFVYDELFYQTRIGGINENRAGVGVSFKLHERLSLALYYQVRHTRKRADWKSSQVLGTIWTIQV